MRERKPYPNISDEELDRRAEETLRRMLNNPKQAAQLGQPGPHGQNHQNGPQGGHQGGGHQGGGHQGGHQNPNQPGGGGGGGGRKRRQRRRPR
jgi:hypothetical protein